MRELPFKTRPSHDKGIFVLKAVRQSLAPDCISGGKVSMLSAMRKADRCLLALVLLSSCVCIGEERMHGNKAARIEELVARYKEYGYLNGAVLVGENGKVIYAKGVGNANMETHTANTPHTRFGIASLTKQFTAVLVLQQVDEGQLKLDGKVADYLPWYCKDTGNKMTVEELLHHTSGLPGDFDQPEFSDSPEAARHSEPLAFAQASCQPTLASFPGTKWEYSNCGYNLLGLILENVTRKSFGDLLRERLLDPLGLKDTGMNRNDLAQSGGASGYKRHAGPRYTPGPYLDQSHFYAAGAMYSTVEDLFRWDEALTHSNLFSSQMREQIFKPGLNNWAYGWFVTRIPPGEPGALSLRAEMRGDMPGNFFSWIIRYPEQDAVVIVLRNGYGSTEHFEENLQAILFDQRVGMPWRSPKDVVVGAWLKTAGWVAAHAILTALVLVAILAGFWQWAHLRKRGAQGVTHH
jgi:CubicO group peptidase (beta-lactamase class C family)